jgi:hypothetical protein
MAELEASAGALAKLIEEREDDEPHSASTAMTDLFASARAGKARTAAGTRRRDHRPRPQARDERGRFCQHRLDGGAREPAPRPGPTHDEWLGDLLGIRRADVGASF